MDQELPEHTGNPIVITGAGCEVPAVVDQWFTAGMPAAFPLAASLAHDADPLPFLRVRKSVKFMSKQDRLALVAAARAVQAAGLPPDVLEMQTMVAMCVGVIPFEVDEARLVAEQSRQGQCFSMERFCRDAYAAVNPMLLFACLPNMPAYHISANLGVRGGYYLGYPSRTESGLALREAVAALKEDRVGAVLYGAVADQQNFLVQNHHRKTSQALPAPDGAVFVVLETESHARARQATVLGPLPTLGEWIGTDGPGKDWSFHLGPVEVPLAVVHSVRRGRILSLGGEQRSVCRGESVGST